MKEKKIGTKHLLGLNNTFSLHFLAVNGGWTYKNIIIFVNSSREILLQTPNLMALLFRMLSLQTHSLGNWSFPVPCRREHLLLHCHGKDRIRRKAGAEGSGRQVPRCLWIAKSYGRLLIVWVPTGFSTEGVNSGSSVWLWQRAGNTHFSTTVPCPLSSIWRSIIFLF